MRKIPGRGKEEVEVPQKEIDIIRRMYFDPIYFVEHMFNLKPVKNVFMKGKNITPQQLEILEAMKNAVNNNGKRRISVRSGHGVGKSATMSWILLWFLFTRKDAQIACTAPTTSQMHDVLWKECAKWIQRMPSELQSVYEWTTNYIRIVDNPKVWFARAKTGRKESPEALAGVHGDHVLFLCDEASGIPDEVFNTAEWALTDRNSFVVMISNPTRLEWYFYDSFHSDSDYRENLHFSSEDSPIVDKSYVQRIVDKHGVESDEYKIRVLGDFPDADMMDDGGWVRLIDPDKLHFTFNSNAGIWPKVLGVDPAGEWKDETLWVVRTNDKAQVVAREKISNPKGIAQKTATLAVELDIPGERIIYDNFGVWANVGIELAMMGTRARGINVGKKEPSDRYINLRARLSWDLREWLYKWWQLVNKSKRDDLKMMRYKRALSGLLQMMSKKELRKNFGRSPDTFDALMLTFMCDIDTRKIENRQKRKQRRVFYDPVTMELQYVDPLDKAKAKWGGLIQSPTRS